MRVRHVGLAFLGLAAVSACSVALNWNQDGLPCEFDSTSGKYSCLAGFTCALTGKSDPNANLCIRDHTIPPNSNCQKDVQCVEGYTCPSGICKQICDPNHVYLADSACPQSGYCKPYYTTAGYTGRDTPTYNLEAACVDSDACSVGNACDPVGGTAGSGICLAVSASSSACVVGCGVYFNNPTLASSYQETCLKSVGGNYNTTCQAIGPTTSAVTSCVTDFPQALPEGAPCNNSVSQPCDTGYTCWAGKCSAWCPVTSTPGSACRKTGQYCCPTSLSTGSGTLLGYCAASQSDCQAN